MASQRDGTGLIEIEGWLNGKASWLRAAALGLIQDRRMPNDPEVNALADHCLLEAANRLNPPSPPLDAGAIEGAPGRSGLRIDRIFDIRGVNALGDQARLELTDTDLAIVYGPNGSGKSGYARLMKHLCGARLAGSMHGNVFIGAADTPSATVEIRMLEIESRSDGTTALNWSITDGPLKQLKAVPVFDTDTSIEFGDSATSATHAPRSMIFVGRLIEISDAVRARLRQRIDELVSQMVQLPADLAQSPAANVLRMMFRAKPSVAAIEVACAFSEDERLEREALEASLAQANPAELSAKAIAELERLAKHKQSALDRESSTSDEKVAEIIAARVDAVNKRAAATAHAAAFFEGMPLKGVGEEVWRQMWRAAEAYANAYAYPCHEHPNTDEGARCVLCQQVLDKDGKARMASFVDYIQDRLQSNATAAEQYVTALEKVIPGIPELQAWETWSHSIGFDPQKGEALRQAVEARTAALMSAVDVEAVPAVDWSEWHAALTAKTDGLEKERDKLAELVDEEGRRRSQARLLELRGKEWLATQIEYIRMEVLRLRQVDEIEAAAKLTWTNALTVKNNEIAAAELAQGFCDRFNEEVRRLGGGRLPVVMAHRSQGKGRFTFCAELRNPKRAIHNREVLSEGERRVIALAAFLADATGSDRSLPIVFDDPISSLDQRFEEAVADRISELAESRQVIVFTHRLSLVALLQAAHEKRATRGSQSRCAVLSITRDGDQTGVPSSIDAFSLKPKPGLGQLISNIGAAKKLEARFRQAALKDACSTFRILVERTVEVHLCANIVGRFRREINTKGLLRKLVAVEVEDCILLDDLMTKYSAYEHSQSDETPTHLPEPDELIADATALREWIIAFDKRAQDVVEGNEAA